MPDSISGWMLCGIHCEYRGATSGIMPTPMEMATISALCRLCVKSTPPRMRMPVAATMPNITSPAPPSTTVGSDSTSAAILGSRPSTSRMMPAATQTKRLFTPVTATSPTFCEKLVYGKVLKMPPISVPRPSVRRPRARAGWSILRSVISPRARNMPVDSIITTIITSDMVRIITGSKTGTPKWNGSTMSNQGALPTLSKFIMPAAVATTPPTTMPSSTEMLAMKPRVNRAISRMVASTMTEIPRPDSAA